MPSVDYKERLVFDKHFFDYVWTYGKFGKSKPAVGRKLMTINDKALGRSRINNIMSKKIFDNILKENPKWERDVLRSLFYPKDDKAELEAIEDEVQRNIKIAIDLLEDPPHKTLIITSEEMEQKYSSNPHYRGVSEIKVVSGEAAMEIINDYFYKAAPSD